MLQSHVPPQQPSGSFQFLAFNTAAQAPPQMDALEMQLASMQGMPSYGELNGTFAMWRPKISRSAPEGPLVGSHSHSVRPELDLQECNNCSGTILAQKSVCWADFLLWS